MLNLLVVVGAVIASIVIPFVVIPELLTRAAYNPRNRRARALVWISFLALVFGPAAATGGLVLEVPSVADVLLLAAWLSVAVVYDYYALNPDRIPWRGPKRVDP